ncbi:MAG TPA: sarcosine oxidase subunit gamma family protein [Caulobacteraceae bacterium]|nr:sarcosine oxidase subunit gamma family protein [Caulobacteraceae bacterium]
MAEPLHIQEQDDLAIAMVMARKGVDAATLGARLGFSPPTTPHLVDGPSGVRLIGVGPGAWLALAHDPPAGWAAFLADALAGVAAVSDQSSAYVVLRLSGPGAQDLMQSGVSIDLHPDSFPPGAAAITAIAHIGVTLWKLDDAPTFEVAVFRSFAAAFRAWIAAASAHA